MSQLLIRILSGPHVGAEMMLGEGQHTIGSGENADLILNDPLIVAIHAELQIDGGSIHCLAKEGAVVMDGAEHSEVALAPFQPFTLGTTHLAIGPADQQWPTIELPHLANPRANVPEPEESAGALDQQTAVTTDADVADADETDDDEAASKTGPSMGSAVWMAALGLAALLVPLLIFVASLWMRPAYIEQEVSDRERVERILQEFAEGEALEISEQEGALFVSGFLDTKQQRRELLTTLYEQVPGLSARIVDTESLVDSVKEVIGMGELSLDAQPGAPGEVVVTGQIDDEAVERWATAKKRIERDVRLLDKLTDRVGQAAQAVLPPAVATETTMNANPAAMPPTVMEESVPAPKMVKAKPGEGPTLAFTGVVIGDTRMVTLSDGRRIFEGAAVGDGYFLAEINANQLVLRKGNEQRIVSIGALQ